MYFECEEATEQDEISPPTLAEVTATVIQLSSNNKGSEMDNTEDELVKYGGDELHKDVHALIQKI